MRVPAFMFVVVVGLVGVVPAEAAMPVDAHGDGVVLHQAEQAAVRAFWRDVAEARNLLAWVDAVNAPPEVVEVVQPQRQRDRRASAPATPFAGNTAGEVNGYPCGGDLPPCSVLKRESGGNPKAENPSSSASGLWQFIDGTWNNYGGYSHASDAPPEVQNAKAAEVWAGGAGCGHWSQTGGC